MTKKALKKEIEIVYRQVEEDPQETELHLSRAFELIFEAVLKNEKAIHNPPLDLDQ